MRDVLYSKQLKSVALLQRVLMYMVFCRNFITTHRRVNHLLPYYTLLILRWEWERVYLARFLYLKSLYPKQQKTRCITATGFSYLALAMFYFHMGNPHYHRRCFVSLLSSAWGQVGPKRYSHQEILFINEVYLINVNPEKAIKFFVYFSLLTSVA